MGLLISRSQVQISNVAEFVLFLRLNSIFLRAIYRVVFVVFCFASVLKNAFYRDS